MRCVELWVSEPRRHVRTELRTPNSDGVPKAATNPLGYDRSQVEAKRRVISTPHPNSRVVPPPSRDAAKHTKDLVRLYPLLPKPLVVQYASRLLEVRKRKERLHAQKSYLASRSRSRFHHRIRKQRFFSSASLLRTAASASTTIDRNSSPSGKLRRSRSGGWSGSCVMSQMISPGGKAAHYLCC